MKPILTPTSITLKEVSFKRASKLLLKLCSDNNIPVRWFLTSLEEDLPKTITVEASKGIAPRDYSLTISAVDDRLNFVLNNRLLTLNI